MMPLNFGERILESSRFMFCSFFVRAIVLIIESDRLSMVASRTQFSHQLHRGHLQKKGLSHVLAGGQRFLSHS